LFTLAPEEQITEAQAEETLRWVRSGGTLILVVPDPPLFGNQNKLLEQLQATVINDDDLDPVERAEVVQPLLTDPPLLSVPVNTQSVLELSRDDYVPLLSSKLGPSVVGLQEGRGYVYLATSVFPFSNQGLRETGSAALILNLLARAPRDATVLFNEFHHGYNTPPTLRGAILRQWWGWSAFYAVLVVVLYIVLTGRRFGRPIPLRADVARRASAEYIHSLAMLFRRARKQSYMLEHYRNQLKRRLARPYGFVPPADDAAFVKELQRYHGANDEQAERLRALLEQFRRTANDEQLVRLVRAADAFVDGKGRIR
ncbi:MAG TPA: DUF4350 domain-containing protein, partial [Herpetosiphonaceae bacterium]